MPPDFDARLRAMAEVVVRVGLNLQPGQPLLVTDPYDLQGVHPGTGSLTDAVRSAVFALEPGRPRPGIEILSADPTRLRALVETDALHGYEALVADHTRRLRLHLAKGGAFLFLTGSAPRLFARLPTERLALFHAAKWRRLGPIIQQLVRGAAQWTLVPVPTADWTAAAGVPLPALWDMVFSALRIPPPVGGALCPDGLSTESRPKAAPTTDPLTAWSAHLAALDRRRDDLNAARHHRIRYTGPGTDLTLDLPRSHVWSTTRLVTRSGVPYVANLPTEEIFTAPHQRSATGTVRVSRPVTHNGCVISGIALEFRAGRVVRARADTGEDHLHHLLATDDGATRLGEVALVPTVGGALRPDWNEAHASSGHKAPPTGESSTGPRSVTDRPYPWQTALPVFHHILLDENAGPHIALGDAYRFCSRAWFPLALNTSQLHLDLPLDATVELS